MGRDKRKEPAVWGETGREKWFEALVDGTHALLGIELRKGGEYLIPENMAGREVFKPSSPPLPPEAKKEKEG